MTRTRHRADDEGFTLVEVLISIVILAIAFTAMLTGLSTIMTGSDTHRKGSVSGTLLRQWAEGVEAMPAITSCTGVPAQYSYALATGATAPANYTLANPTVSFWTGTAFSSLASACKIGSEQQITFTVASSDSRVPSGKQPQLLTIVKLQS